MLRNRGNDGDVVLGVAGVKEGVETASPWSNFAQSSEHSSSSKGHTTDQQDQRLEQNIEVLLGHLSSQVVNKGVDLTQAKHSKSLEENMTHITLFTKRFPFFDLIIMTLKIPVHPQRKQHIAIHIQSSIMTIVRY